MRKLFGPISIIAVLLCLIISAAAGAGAYLIGHSLTPVYQSSGTIRIGVPAQNGVSDPQVTASNDLATQYSQLAGSAPVEALTAKALNVAPSSLDGKLSGSTVGAQNLVQISASARTAGVAQQRATAAVHALADYLARVTRLQSARYLAAIRQGLLAKDLPGWVAQGLPRGRHGLDDTKLATTVAGQRALTLGQGVRDVAGNQPTFQIVDTGSSASQTSPKPNLYAVIAFIVALLITTRIAFVLSRPDPFAVPSGPPASWERVPAGHRNYNNVSDGETAAHSSH